MHYQTLGHSGCVVSRYALGTMTFGAETDQTTAWAQLDQFAAVGGTLIDCADVYSAGAAERIVGGWLSSRPAQVTDPMVVLTKGRFPFPDAPPAQGSSRRHLRMALDASLQRLGRTHVDVYMPHAWDPLTPIEETMSFLDDAVRQGKILYPALSNFLGWQVERAAGVSRQLGLARPVACQVAYSLLVREIESEILPASVANDIGILAWSPLGGGWLTGKYSREESPNGQTRLGEDPTRGIEAYDGNAADPRTWRIVAGLRQVAVALNASPAQVALAWVAQRPGVTSVLLGARTLEQLKDNLDATEVTLSEEDMRQLTEVSRPLQALWPYGQAGREQRSRPLV
jgi:aryl-alcohol dehydrogenase-like predicted oxidoreductase